MKKSAYTRFYWLFILISLIHIFFIIKNSVNIPFMDEWELFKENSFMLSPSIDTLFKQHNEHKLVIPNLFFYLMFQFNGFNVTFIQIFNFSFYILIVFMFQKIIFKTKTHPLIPYLTLVLVSPLNFENHFWPFQIQWHFVVLFSFLSTVTYFKEKKIFFDYMLAIIFPFLIIYSLGSGLGVIILQILIFNILSFTKISNSSVKDKLFNLIYTFLGIFFIYFYLRNYVKPGGHPDIFLPYTITFWHHLLTQVSIGLNIENGKNFILGIIPLYFYINNFVLLYKSSANRTQRNLIIFTLSTLFLGMMSLISLSRSGFGSEQGASSRYFEFSAFFFVLVFSQNIMLKEKISAQIKYALLPILFFLTIKNLNFEKIYSPLHQTRANGFNCAKLIYTENKGDTCPDIYPWEIKSILDNLRSKKIKVSFVEDFN